MSSYFDTVFSFKNVPITSDGIEVEPFLKACQGLAGIMDSLGSAFGVIKSDIQGNITKIQAKYNENPAEFKTLESFVKQELAGKQRPASEGLLWLKRTLEFTALGLRRSADDPKEELKTSFSTAYTATLSPFHNFMIRPVFSMAMSACPYRADFYKTLGDSTPGFKEKFDDWLTGLENVTKKLVDFYAVNGIDKNINAK